MLCAHVWGGSGFSFVGRTDRELVDVILDLLDRMFPTQSSNENTIGKRGIPEPLSYLVTRWSEDPFALGAYTTGEPGSMDDDRVEYARTLTELDMRQSMIKDQEMIDYGVADLHKTTEEFQANNPRLLFAGEGTLTGSEAKVSFIYFIVF